MHISEDYRIQIQAEIDRLQNHEGDQRSSRRRAFRRDRRESRGDLDEDRASADCQHDYRRADA